MTFPFTDPVNFASPKIWLLNVPVSFSPCCCKTTVGLPEPWLVSTVTCHVPETSAANAIGMQQHQRADQFEHGSSATTVSESEAHVGQSSRRRRISHASMAPGF